MLLIYYIFSPAVKKEAQTSCFRTWQEMIFWLIVFSYFKDVLGSISCCFHTEKCWFQPYTAVWKKIFDHVTLMIGISILSDLRHELWIEWGVNLNMALAICLLRLLKKRSVELHIISLCIHYLRTSSNGEKCQLKKSKYWSEMNLKKMRNEMS